MHTTEQLCYSTIRIECNNGSTGSGFFFRFFEHENNSVPAIVTNKHVIDGAEEITVYIRKADENDKPIDTESIGWRIIGNSWIMHPEKDIDLCVLPIGGILSKLHDKGQRVFYTAFSFAHLPTKPQVDKLLAVEDILMVGYPNGLWDSVNNLPIVRRGITATHPKVDYCGKNEFLIDSACYPGSSGSPVFIFNQLGYVTNNNEFVNEPRLLLMGILHAGPVQTITGDIVNLLQHSQVISQVMIHLGNVVKSEKLLDFEKIIRQKIAEVS